MLCYDMLAHLDEHVRADGDVTDEADEADGGIDEEHRVERAVVVERAHRPRHVGADVVEQPESVRVRMVCTWAVPDLSLCCPAVK